MKTYTNTPTDPLEVMKMIKRASLGLRDKEGKEIVVGLKIGGGAFSTIWALGWSLGLQKTGLHKSIRVIIGISGGAVVGTALNMDQLENAPAVYARLVNDMQFINFLRWGKFMDHTYLFELLGKLFPPEAFCNGAAELYAVVTKYPSGEGELLKLDIDVMRATTAIPVPLFCKPVYIGGTPYVDGACCFYPVRRIVEKFKITDLIYLGSRPHIDDVPKWKRDTCWYSTHAALSGSTPPAIRHGLANVDMVTKNMLDEMQSMRDVRCVAFLPSYKSAIPALPPPWSFWPFEKMDAETVLECARRGEASFNKMFASLKDEE